MSVYLSVEQVAHSLGALSGIHPFFGYSFLAFKKTALPVGATRDIVFSQVAQELLVKYYKPAAAYDGFYNPFKTSDNSKRWNKPRYASTSLQRITADTFGDSLLHKKGSSKWGWRDDYILKLKQHLGAARVPSFHLGVWLFRDDPWPEGVKREDLIERFYREFDIESQERSSLFEDSYVGGPTGWTADRQLLEGELYQVIKMPPGWAPPPGATLRALSLREVGPVRSLQFEPAERLNVITGDNSLGKTFLLECIWWAITGDWLGENAIIPRREAPRNAASIQFSLTSQKGKAVEYKASFNWNQLGWSVNPSTPRSPGLVVYARFDGSFAVFDPARGQIVEQNPKARASSQVLLSRDEVWDGARERGPDRSDRWVCNGLLRDWIAWQTGGEQYKSHFNAFKSSLAHLSPSNSEILEPGPPERLPLDSRPVPTIRMPYGPVLISHASAAVRRIAALAYVLVWAWQEHIVTSMAVRQEPQRQLVLVIDEVEAHLHPRWQRLIVPAIMRVASGLSLALRPQLYVATHSPMVLASIEPDFDRGRDRLHHLKMKEDGQIEMKQIPFAKRGTADLWLMSGAFEMAQARSLQAERSIQRAIELQLLEIPDANSVREVDADLVRLLAPDDEFWPRWRYFAEQYLGNVLR